MQMMHSVMYQTCLNQGVICFKYTILLYGADVNGISSLLLREVRISIEFSRKPQLLNGFKYLPNLTICVDNISKNVFTFLIIV